MFNVPIQFNATMLKVIAGPTGLWPDSLLRAQIVTYQIFNDPKIL